jgi:hypothetical protein
MTLQSERLVLVTWRMVVKQKNCANDGKGGDNRKFNIMLNGSRSRYMFCNVCSFFISSRFNYIA